MSIQTEIPFENIIQVFDGIKRKRRVGLAKTGIFTDVELDFLLKITYDLTDKDFEYFIAILLEKDGFETAINGGRQDRWVDILAKKYGKTFAVQCKQWSKARITLKDAGAYYASIFEKMKQNKDFIFAYVTTSFIPKDVEEYFLEHGIPGMISNKKIIEECRKLGFFTEKWWKNLIEEIRDRRLKDLFLHSQMPLFVDKKIFQRELIVKRLREIKNHLPYELRFKKSKIEANNALHQEFYENFFKHWNL